MRRLLRAVPTALVLLAFGAGALGAVQAAVATVAPGHLIQLGFVDAAANRQSSPLIRVRNAYPGMRPQTSAVGVRNWGTTAASYDLVVVLPDDLGASPVAEVLSLTIRGSGGRGEIVYRGSVAGAAVASTRPLSPGAAAHYRFIFRWDDNGGRDNRYQGHRTTFRLEIRGRPAA